MVVSLLETSPDPMSATTALVLQLALIAVTMGSGAILWWVRREVTRLDKRIDCHEEFVSETTEDLTSIKVDLSGIKSDINSIKNTLGDLAESNRDVIKYMLSHKSEK